MTYNSFIIFSCDFFPF